MFILRRRLTAIFVCVALLGAIDTADARRHLNIRYASADASAHTDPVVATLGLDGLSARLFASSRTQRLDNVHPAIAGSRAVVACAGRAMRLRCESTRAIVSTPIRPRAARGPPPHVLA